MKIRFLKNCLSNFNLPALHLGRSQRGAQDEEAQHHGVPRQDVGAAQRGSPGTILSPPPPPPPPPPHLFISHFAPPPPVVHAAIILRTSKPSFASHPAPHPGVDVQGVRPSKPTVRDNPGSGVRTLYPPVLCVTFLKKLSIYRENKDKMLECNIIDKLARWGLCKWNAVDP
jgi:hypothetical protein